MKHYISFLILLLLYAVGLLIFTRGFLLNRTVISTNSSCAPPRYGSTAGANDSQYSSPGGCWLPKSYDRAVIIIIDALRFDFVFWNGSTVGGNSESSQVKPLFANRLRAISDAVAKQPSHAKLYRFRADAPTTTLQRLKGLTTGSLPTFVDAGANFASTEISEDNIIDQLRKTWLPSDNLRSGGRRGGSDSGEVAMGGVRGNESDEPDVSHVKERGSEMGTTGSNDTDYKRIPVGGSEADSSGDISGGQSHTDSVPSMTFMGDDTWMSLFPGRFSRSFSYPSFNVRDLHTVDNGVIERLVPEIERMKEGGEKGGGLVVAHLLGVDHCGHTYGPNTSVMRDKLDQMNRLISAVMGAVDDRTLLAVMGDHGMTRTGDHGGDSEDEVMSALFLYSKHRPLTSKLHPPANQDVQEGQYQTVSQVDLVPSLSLLLGSPIPFSSLGRIIDDLFHDPTEPSNDSYSQIFPTSLVSALRVNALQINRYIEAYAQQSGTNLPTNEVNRLNSVLAEAEREFVWLDDVNQRGTPDLTRLQAVRDLYRTYLIGVREMCQTMWAQFDLLSMFNGMLICFIAFMINVSMIRSDSSVFSAAVLALRGSSNKSSVAASMFISVAKLVLATMSGSVVYLTLQSTGWDAEPLHAAATSLLIVSSCSLVLSESLATLKRSASLLPKFADVFGLVLWSLYIVSLLSNSFVVYEDKSSVFLTQSLFLVLGLSSSVLKRRASQKKPDTRPATLEKQDMRLNHSAVIYLLVMVTLLRVTYLYHSCREEQIDCNLAPPSISQFFLQPLSSLSDQLQTLRVVVATVSMATLVYAVREWLSHYGNLNGPTWGAYIIRNVCPAMVALLASYWLISSVSAHSGKGSTQLISKLIPDWLPLSLAKSVYVLAGVVLIAMIHSPLCLLKLERRSQARDNSVTEFRPNTEEDLVPQYYRLLRSQWSTASRSAGYQTTAAQRGGRVTDSQAADGSNENIPVVFGLATAYSSSHLVVITTVAIVMAMLLGDGLASSILVLGAVLFVSLELHAAQTGGNEPGVSLLGVCSLCFIASQHFFAAGHQCTIPSIRFESAFHGFRGEFPTFLVPAALITFNTFLSQILCAASLPLLLYWPMTRGRGGGGGREEEEEGGAEKQEEGVRLRDKGELVLCEDDSLMMRSLYSLHVKYILLLAARLMACMLCAALHRRHLMVWKIFAPRFVYEGASFLVSCAACLLSYAYVLRVHRALSRWIQHNIYKPSSS